MEPLRFSHLTGASSWLRCELEGLVEDPVTGGVRLATDQEDADLGDVNDAEWESWRGRRGGAVWRPLGPEDCAEREVWLAEPQGSFVWDGAAWVRSGQAGPCLGLAVDADGCWWALEREGESSSFRRWVSWEETERPRLEAPPGLTHFALCTDGLVAIDAGGVWWWAHGRWRSVPLPEPIVALKPVAVSRWGDGAVVLLRGGGRCGLGLVRRGRLEGAPLLGIRSALGLLGLSNGDVLVGELVAGAAGGRVRVRFGAYRAGMAAGGMRWGRVEGWQAVGFDGRALFTDAEGLPWCTTRHGPRRLYRRPDRIVGAPSLYGPGGVVGELRTIHPLEADAPATHWHRLFLDIDLPEDCSARVFVFTSDTHPADAVEPQPPRFVELSHLDRRPYRADRPELPDQHTHHAVTLEGVLPTFPGRYLSLRVLLVGTARATPTLLGVRVTWPRPSLLQLLPSHWRMVGDDEPTSEPPSTHDESEPPRPAVGNQAQWARLERALALYEGLLSELGARVEQLPELWDPRATAIDALPWLARLIAVEQDPGLNEATRRLLLVEGAALHRARGTVQGIKRLCEIVAGCEVRIVEAFRLRRPTGAMLGVQGETPWSTPGAVLGPGLTLTEGQPDQEAELFYGATAHRFVVVLGRAYDAETAARVQRAVEASRPAHTLFELRWADGGWRLGDGDGLDVGLAPAASERDLTVASLVLGAESTPPGGRIGPGQDGGVVSLHHPIELYKAFPGPPPGSNRSPS